MRITDEDLEDNETLEKKIEYKNDLIRVLVYSVVILGSMCVICLAIAITVLIKNSIL